MAGITIPNLDDQFEVWIVEWFFADRQTCARNIRDKRRRGEPLDDHLPDAILAAAASHRLLVLTRSADEPRNAGVATVDRWTAGPR